MSAIQNFYIDLRTKSIYLIRTKTGLLHLYQTYDKCKILNLKAVDIVRTARKHKVAFH